MIDSSAKNALFSSENRERIGLHYLGISLILAWYYCLWFTPNFFTSTPITDNNVTFSWLSTLALTGIAFLVTPMAFRKIRFYDHQKTIPAIAGIMAVATFAFGVLGLALESPVLALVVFPLVFAVCNAVFWVAWGEFHARRKSNFSLSKFVFIFGSVMLCLYKRESGARRPRASHASAQGDASQNVQGDRRHLGRDLPHVRRMLFQHRDHP